MAEPHHDQPESDAAGRPLKVGDWRVEPRELLLRREGGEQRLEPRVMALLLCLAEHSGRAVTRQELLERVWHDVVVGDDAVHSAVSKLRRALRDGCEGPVIETVPRVGYRLVAPVERMEGVTTSTALESPGRSVASRRAIPRSGRRWAWGLVVAVLALAGLVLTRSADMDSPRGAPDVRPLTSWPGLEVEPAFAPGDTGDRVAFAWEGPAGDNWDLWVQVLGAGDPLRLTDHPASDHYPAWSPDGRHLAFLRYENGRCKVLRVPALGGPERVLVEVDHAEALHWSPDGERLVWSERSSPGESLRIVALTLPALQREELTKPPAGSVGDLSPVISPDGRTLGFLRSPVLGVEDIHLQSLEGGKPRRLTWDALKVHGIDWMPSGEQLVYSSNRGGLFSLWTVGIDGSEPTWLGVSGGDLDAPSVGRAGQSIAYEQWNDDTNIYRLGLAPGSEPERRLGSTRWDWAPHASNQGLVFVSDRSGAPELWVEPVDSATPPRRLTEFAGPYLHRPRWSPDGRTVAFDARPGGNADIYRVDGDGSHVHRMTTSPAQDVAPTWSADGERIYFSSDRGGGWGVWRMHRSGGIPVQIVGESGGFAQESPDGRWLYFSRRHEPGIWRGALRSGGSAPNGRLGSGERSEPAEGARGDGLAAVRVVDDLAPLDRYHWITIDGGLLYVRRPRPDRPVLIRWDAATGRSEQLGTLGPIPYNSGLSLGPGGEAVLFTRIDRLESDILVLDLGG